MKKTLLILSVLLAFGTVQAQKKEPTKKQTFDFIVQLLSNVDKSSVTDIGSFNLKEYDYEDLKITFSGGYSRYNGYKYNCNYTVVIDLKDLDEVDNYTYKEPKIRLNFKTENSCIITVKGNCVLNASGVWHEKKLSLMFNDNKIVDRLEKALNHLKKVSGNNVDETLFDN